MSTSTKPIPVLATGKAEAIGLPVCQGLLPEVEVIHYTLAEAIDRELPLLLKGEQPETKSSSIAPGSWESGPPVAILLGGAYEDADIELLRESLGLATVMTIPWLRIDSKKSTIKHTEPGYAADVVQRFKAGLQKLQSEGKLGGKDNGVYGF